MNRCRALPLITGLIATALWVGAAGAQTTGGTGFGGSTGGSTSGGSSGGTSATGVSSQGFGPGSLSGQQGKSYAPTESTKTSSSSTNNGNPFNAYYANPQAMGLGGTTSSTSGGSSASGPGYRTSGSTGTTGGTLSNALYPNIYTTTTNSNVRISGLSGSAGGLGGGIGGRGGQMGGINGLTGTGTGNRSYGYVIGNVTTSGPAVTRSPQYTPVSGPDFRISLQQVLARSSSLSSANNVQVVSDGFNTYVLRGSVASDRDRRLAENVLRLSPGVRQVKNELDIVVPPPAVSAP